MKNATYYNTKRTILDLDNFSQNSIAIHFVLLQVVITNEGLTFFNNIISFDTLAGLGLWVKNKKPLQMKLLLDGNLLIMPGCVYITVLSQARPEVSLCFDGVQAILLHKFEH